VPVLWVPMCRKMVTAYRSQLLSGLPM